MAINVILGMGRTVALLRSRLVFVPLFFPVIVKNSRCFAFLTGKFAGFENVAFGRKAEPFLEQFFDHVTGYVWFGLDVNANIFHAVNVLNDNLIMQVNAGNFEQNLFHLTREKVDAFVISIDLSDKRLESRYFELVKAHLQHSLATAAGPSIPAADLASNFSATQATWRFFANEKVTPTALNRLPL